jgi:phosphatidylserine decarboxylase
MKHSGKAMQAAMRLITLSLILLVLVVGFGFLAVVIGKAINALAGALVLLWVLFAIFTFYFFRDPTPSVPSAANAIVAPGHGKVDVIDETTEAEFMGGPCKRISIFLSVVDVHVQQSPIAARVAHVQHHPGEFMNALKTECAACNENVLIGLESTEQPGEKISVRLIAGLIARRIIPWVNPGDSIARGERISLIQFGSRVDLYLPLTAKITAKLGDRVVGGETIVATRN